MTPLDLYDNFPDDMRRYLSQYGWNFNRKAYECAARAMWKKDSAGNKQKVEIMSKDAVNEFLSLHGINLEYNAGYNAAYVLAMAKSDYYGSSIVDDKHLALFVKNYIDDPDNQGGNPFRKWYADCVAKGTPVDWEDIF